MKINDLTEDGRIVKGVNTTPDVQPGETERQAKKLFPMNKNGKPQSLGVPGASPNVAFNLGLTEDELTTVQRAELFAQQAHKDHQRKYTGDPYYVHLDEVRRIVKGAGGSEDMQAAALLHDTVEDTSVTSADIMKEFGPRIAKLVVELTDVSKPEDGNRAVRKGIDRDKLAGVSAEAQTIKYADLISNGKDIMQNDPKFAKVYMKEKADLLRVMTKGDSNLRSAALAMLPDELKENMSVTGTERRRLEKKKGLEIGSPEWFKHWFDLPYLREDKKDFFKAMKLLAKFVKTRDDQDAFRAIKFGWSYIQNPMMRKSIVTLIKYIASLNGHEDWDSTVKYIRKNTGVDITDYEQDWKSAKGGYTFTQFVPEDLNEKYDDVGQKIYKGNTTRVVNTPVADKNISVADKRIAKFSQQRDMDDMTYKGAKITMPGTNQAIAKAKSNIDRAYSKQDKIDQRQGAGQSYITKGKPVKFPSSDKVQLNMSEGIQKVDVEQLEKFADRLFGKVGIDVEFTRHFMDRVNDIRNQKPITMSELTRLFKQEYKRWGKPIAQMGPDSQAVMKDLQTDINLPFVLKWDEENNELDLIAKTIMRKADFKTPNKEFPVEDVKFPSYVDIMKSKPQSKEPVPDIAPAHIEPDGRVRGLYPDPQDAKQRASNIFYKAGRGLSRLIKGDPDYDPYDQRDAEVQKHTLPMSPYKDGSQRSPDNYPSSISRPMTDSETAKMRAEIGAEFGLTGDQVMYYSNKDAPLPSQVDPKLIPKGTKMPTDAQVQAYRKARPPVFSWDSDAYQRYNDLRSSEYDYMVDEAAPMTKRTGAGGSVTTVGGQEIARSTPKIGGFQSTSYADGSVKDTLQTSTPDGVNIKQTRVNGKDVGTDIQAGAMGMKATGTPQNLNVNQMKYDMGGGTSVSADATTQTATIQTPKKKTVIDMKPKGNLKAENVPNTNKPGSLGQMINWAGKNAPDKPKSNISVARRKQPEPQNWWQNVLQKGRNLFDDEQLELKKKFEITDELKQLDSIFKKGKHEIRIVGGAVRDLALGKSPKDIDLATDATPQEMQKMFDSAGVKHIPTGIEHGTITAVMNGEPYEITTLRADVETDGRRAEVEFVRSWEEDAKRRDLTYNAMSMDFDGNLYDYHGGMDDLQDKVTRFVGDPEERIKEDYLRTLRYFRFQGRLDTPTFDRTTMNAIADNTDGLKQLSVERIWMEMGKILGGSNIQQILGAMDKTGVLDAIGLKAKPSKDLMDGGDPIINLARITDDESIGPRWKMSNEEKGKLGFLIQNKGKTYNKDWYTNMMVDGFDRTQLDALARYNNQDDMIQHIKTFKAPEFPVNGNDLIKLGHERGPKIGQTLNALRAQWKAGNFSASKDELLQSMNEEGPFGVLARKASHVINKSQYMKAAEFLHKILQRKYKETGGKLRHTLGYYAQMIANQTGNKINWRELQAEYLDTYGNTMFEKINKNTPMGDVIDDFQQSDAPQFKGKSQEKRRQMAIAAKLSMMDSVDQKDTKMPTVSLKDLYHVGTLDASKKGDFSYEGAGLSVTTEPDAWRRIARGQVAGDTHSVAKANNNFLDSHKLTSQHNEQIKQWAIDNGFLEQQETVTVSWYDDEMDDTLSQTFNSMADAEAEHGEYMDDYDVDVDKGGVVPTAKLQKATGQSRIETTGVLEYVLPLYAESLGLDGVWWADDLDVNKLSAPRGVIVPGKVDSFKFNRMNENFADGKKPGRKGLSKRVGIPKNATIAQLEKIAKNSTGERRRMAQWQLNMRRGKNKSK